MSKIATANQLGARDEEGKADLLLKVFGFLNFAAGAFSAGITVFVSLLFVNALKAGQTGGFASTPIIVFAVHLAVALALAIMFVVLGVRLIKNKRRHAGIQTNAMIALAVVNLLTVIMLTGFKTYAWCMCGILMYLVFLHVKVDPTLYDERQLQFKLRQMETRTEAEEGTLGRDLTGKGYLKLDFFNMFWIFVLCCIAGIAIETLYCFAERGVWENRTGLLWGWFSPIYGFGGLLISIALNRFYNKNIVITYVVSAIVGAAFEFFVSWFFENAFGIKAWDYSGAFMSIDGRTDLFHALCWGVLGTVWVRFLMQMLLKIINKIPWQWRYSVTTVCALFMIANCAMTMLSIDCWVNRVNHTSSNTPIERFFAEHYPDDRMQEHFETMHITPKND